MLPGFELLFKTLQDQCSKRAVSPPKQVPAGSVMSEAQAPEHPPSGPQLADPLGGKGLKVDFAYLTDPVLQPGLAA